MGCVCVCIPLNPRESGPRTNALLLLLPAEALPVRRFARMADSREPPPLFNDDDDSRKDDDNDDLFTSAVQVRQEDPLGIPEKRGKRAREKEGMRSHGVPPPSERWVV